MGFFMKSTKEKAAEIAADFVQTWTDIQKKATEIEKISDPGEKFLALKELKESVDKCKEQIDAKIKGQQNPISGTLVVSGLGGCVYSILMAAATANPLFILAAFGSLFGGAISGLAIEERSVGVYGEPKQRLFSVLDAITQETDRQQKLLLQSDGLPELAASKKFDELYDNCPAVKEAFTRASVREEMLSRRTVRLDKDSRPQP